MPRRLLPARVATVHANCESQSMVPGGSDMGSVRLRARPALLILGALPVGMAAALGLPASALSSTQMLVYTGPRDAGDPMSPNTHPRSHLRRGPAGRRPVRRGPT